MPTRSNSLDSLTISLPLTSNSLDNLDFLTCGEQIDKARHVRKQERRDAETRQREHVCMQRDTETKQGS